MASTQTTNILKSSKSRGSRRPSNDQWPSRSRPDPRSLDSWRPKTQTSALRNVVTLDDTNSSSSAWGGPVPVLSAQTNRTDRFNRATPLNNAATIDSVFESALERGIPIATGTTNVRALNTQQSSFASQEKSIVLPAIPSVPPSLPQTSSSHAVWERPIPTHFAKLSAGQSKTSYGVKRSIAKPALSPIQQDKYSDRKGGKKAAQDKTSLPKPPSSPSPPSSPLLPPAPPQLAGEFPRAKPVNPDLVDPVPRARTAAPSFSYAHVLSTNRRGLGCSIAAAKSVMVNVDWRCKLVRDSQLHQYYEMTVAQIVASKEAKFVRIRAVSHPTKRLPGQYDPMTGRSTKGAIVIDEKGLHLTAEYLSTRGPTRNKWVTFHLYLQEMNDGRRTYFRKRPLNGTLETNPEIYEDSASALPQSWEQTSQGFADIKVDL